jgi:tetratricopeptide (TPR) repeat protein
MVFDVDVTIKEDAFDTRTLSAADAASAQASWQVAMKRPVEARADIAEATKADPKLAAPHDAEGMLLEVENKREEAKAAYATAIELGSTNAAVYYRWARLTWEQQRSPAMLGPVEAALEKATKLNDRRADAFALWAVLKAQTNHADQGLPLALQAVKLDPGDSYTRTTLGHILLMLQRKEEARAQATAALELARSDADKRAAQQLLDRVK